jgi:hypothetical protein
MTLFSFLRMLWLVLLMAVPGALSSGLWAQDLAGSVNDAVEGREPVVEVEMREPSADEAEPVDADLPQRFDEGRLRGLMESSPFTRSVNPSDSLVLSGLAFFDGSPVATIFDSETKESIVVSEKPNHKGWTLVEAVPTADMMRAQAKISIGGEVVQLRYNKEALTPDKLRRERSGDRGPGGGPPPGSGGYERSGPRPSNEDMERYRSLSDKAREKLRDEFNKNRERLMNATPEERAAFMRSTFERVSREDQERSRR